MSTDVSEEDFASIIAIKEKAFLATCFGWLLACLFLGPCVVSLAGVSSRPSFTNCRDRADMLAEWMLLCSGGR
jgi:hypothetical protein